MLVGAAEDVALDLEVSGVFERFGEVSSALFANLQLENPNTLGVFSEHYGAVVSPDTPIESLFLPRGDVWTVGRFDAHSHVMANPSLDSARWAVVQLDGHRAGRLFWLTSEDRLNFGPDGDGDRVVLGDQGSPSGALVSTMRDGQPRVFGEATLAEVLPGHAFTWDGCSFKLLTRREAEKLYTPEGTFALAAPATGRYLPRPSGVVSLPMPRDPEIKPSSTFPFVTIGGGVLMALVFVLVFNRPEYLWLAGVTVAVGILGWVYTARTARRARMRQKERDLEAEDAALAEAMRETSEEADDLRKQVPPLSEVLTLIASKQPGFWALRPGDPSYLHLSLGLASYAPLTQYVGSNASLSQRIKRRCIMEDVPAYVDLGAEHLAVLGDSLPEVALLVSSLVVQILTRHGASACEVIALLPDVGLTELTMFDWLKWPGHVQVGGARGMNAVGADPNDVLGRLLTRFDSEGGTQRSNEAPRTVLVVSEGADVDLALLDQLLAASDGMVRVLWYGSSRQATPGFANVVVRTEDGRSSVAAGQLRWTDAVWGYGKDANRHRQWVELQHQAAKQRSGIYADAGRLFAMVHDRAHAAVDVGIPRLVTLPDVVSALPADEANARDGLVLTAGRSSTGLADIHLRGSESHLLIAGTTGAGKSELLQSMLATAVARYSPAELGLFLFDFKGEATIAPFRELPHLVGSLSNLTAQGIERALGFLEAEILRRQLLLKDADVADYERFRTKGASLPRLLLVFDEYSAMLEEHPKALARVVQVARQGRSLGVHLILATQRPSRDVVTPAITANLGVRIALRTAAVDESELIIGTRAAARIPNDLQGRGFIRVGADELLEFQAAYATGVSGTHAVAAEVSRLTLRRGSVDRPQSEEVHRQVSDLALILRDAADRHRRVSVDRKLWPALDEVSPPPASHAADVLTLGLMDEPTNPLRDNATPFALPATGSGLLFVGATRSGKTTALASVLSGLESTGRESFVVSAVPELQTTHYVDPSSMSAFVLMLERLRHALLKADPCILVLDDIPAILELLGNRDAAATPETVRLAKLIRVGQRRGTLTVAASARSVASVPTVFRALFTHVMQLRAEEPEDLYNPPRAANLPPGFALVGRAATLVRISEPSPRPLHQFARSSELFDLVRNWPFRLHDFEAQTVIVAGKPRTGKTRIIDALIGDALTGASTMVIASHRSQFASSAEVFVDIADLASRPTADITEFLSAAFESHAAVYVDTQRLGQGRPDQQNDASKLLVGLGNARSAVPTGRLVLETAPALLSAFSSRAEEACYESLTITTTLDSATSYMPWLPVDDPVLMKFRPTDVSGAFFSHKGERLGLMGWIGEDVDDV